MTTAKPRISVEAVAFWFVVLTALPALGYHYGYTTGFEDGRNTPARCPDRNHEGKQLSSIGYSDASKQTVCTYVRDVYGRGKWIERI